jgi:hypothetical protein
METVTVEFNQEELNALDALLDVALKSTGKQGVKAYTLIMGKLEAAVAAKHAPVANEVDDNG